MRYGAGQTNYFAEHLGLIVEDVRVDYCRMRLPWRTEVAQPFGVAHGGAIASLLDAVLVPAIGAGYDDPVGFATIDLTVQYLAALRDEDAVAEGWINQRGSSILFGEAEARGATSGTLVAKAVTTFIPSAEKASAKPRPMPLAAPVTTATFPRKSCIPFALLPCRGQRPAGGQERADGHGGNLRHRRSSTYTSVAAKAICPNVIAVPVFAAPSSAAASVPARNAPSISARSTTRARLTSPPPPR